MNFLKKHYEKVALFAFFIIFAILLVHLYFITKSTREVKDEDLGMKYQEAKYEVADLKEDKFNFNKLFSDNILLPKSAPRDSGNSKDFSDLIEVFKITRCGKCKYLIPRRVMEDGERCFHCMEKLLPPKKEDAKSKGTVHLDSDEDGIPNVVEILFGLNPYDASDALLDLDEDGFVNVYEYLELQHTEEFKRIFSDDYKNITSNEVKNMSLNNPQVHPEYYKGLYLDRIDRQKLNANLLGVSVAEKSIQIDITAHPKVKLPRKIRRKLPRVGTSYFLVGDRFTLTTGEYLIKDIRKDTSGVKRVAKRKTDTNTENLDTSYNVILEDAKKREIIMKVGEDTFDLEYTAFFNDVWNYKTYSGRVGDKITMGTARNDQVTYEIKKIDKKTETAVLTPPVKGAKDIVIGQKAMMPKEFIPDRKKADETKTAPENQGSQKRI